MAVEVREREAATAPAPVQGEAVVELIDLRVTYGDRDIIDELSLRVASGQVYGLIGPSGGGKTTIMRTTLGLLHPSDGEARVLGANAEKLTQKMRARIGYVPQQFQLYPNLTVAENLSVIAGLYGMGWRHRRRRIRETLALMELSDDRNKLARKLSGGMQRRLQLAAALLHEPDLLFVDEPTAGIDPILRARFWEHFREITASGRTVFFTTQYVNEAELCDTVALIANGHLLAEGTPAKLRRLAYGGDVVDLASPDLDWTAVNDLSRLPLVTSVERASPGHVRVIVEDSARAVPEMVRALEDTGRHVEATESTQPTFDEVFTLLVKNHA